MSLEVIDSFDGQHLFLSNFYPIQIVYLTRTYPSVENAYQAAKCKNVFDREKFLDITPGQAKRLSKTLEIREDWNAVKLPIMMHLCSKKFFRNKDLAQMLLATGNAKLIEGNTWDDTYWGVCNGVGQNHLGEILMSIRNSLQLDPFIFMRYCDGR